MNSYLTNDFVKCFRKLPERIRQQARKNYKLWKKNQTHPSLEFKKVHQTKPVYSVRVAIGWRALGLKQNSRIFWFWIGSHGEYDHLIKRL